MESNTLEQGRFSFNEIHQYIHNGCYSDGYTKVDKQDSENEPSFSAKRVLISFMSVDHQVNLWLNHQCLVGCVAS